MICKTSHGFERQLKKIHTTNKRTGEQWCWSGLNGVYSFAEKNRQIGKHSSHTKVVGSIEDPLAGSWTLKSPEAVANSWDEAEADVEYQKRRVVKGGLKKKKET